MRHLNNEINEERVGAVQDGFNELLVQNVPNLPPGTAAAWRSLLSFTGSCFKDVGDTYGERLRVIKEDWAVVQRASKQHEKGQEEAQEAQEAVEGEEQGEAEALARDEGAETFSPLWLACHVEDMIL